MLSRKPARAEFPGVRPFWKVRLGVPAAIADAPTLIRPAAFFGQMGQPPRALQNVGKGAEGREKCDGTHVGARRDTMTYKFRFDYASKEGGRFQCSSVNCCGGKTNTKFPSTAVKNSQISATFRWLTCLSCSRPNALKIETRRRGEKSYKKGNTA